MFDATIVLAVTFVVVAVVVRVAVPWVKAKEVMPASESGEGWMASRTNHIGDN